MLIRRVYVLCMLSPHDSIHHTCHVRSHYIGICWDLDLLDEMSSSATCGDV